MYKYSRAKEMREIMCVCVCVKDTVIGKSFETVAPPPKARGVAVAVVGVEVQCYLVIRLKCQMS